MPWAKIERTSASNLPDQPASEMFAFVPFFLKDNLVRGRDVERFTIHFGLRDVPLRGQHGGDRMSRKQRLDVTRRAIVAIQKRIVLKQAIGLAIFPDMLKG